MSTREESDRTSLRWGFSMPRGAFIATVSLTVIGAFLVAFHTVVLSTTVGILMLVAAAVLIALKLRRRHHTN